MSWEHGTARWGDFVDAAALTGEKGLVLGRVGMPRLLDSARWLFRAGLKDSAMAVRAFCNASGLVRCEPWLRLSSGCHAVVVSPTGGGKGTAVVITTAMTDPRNVVVIDPKAENYLKTHEARRAMGHKVVLLDPFGVSGAQSDTFNPLDFIDPKDPLALDAANALADAMVVRTGEEKDPHWNDSASLIIAGEIGFTLERDRPGLRNLQTVCELTSSPANFQKSVAEMQKSTAFGGMLERIGGQISHFRGDELGSVLTSTNRHLRFLNTPAVASKTRASSFDPAELKTGKLDVFLVLPPEQLQVQSGLMRMWITSLLRAIVRTPGNGEILFLLDEAATLGKLEAIEQAIALLRGYGVRLAFFYQSLGQLKKCYPDGGETTFLSNMDTSVFFGITDLETAEYVSKRAGTATVETEQVSEGTNDGSSYQPASLQSVNYGSNRGRSVSRMARELLKADEVLQLGERDAIVFHRGMPPILTRLVRYYETEFREIFKKPRFTVRCVMFALASLFIALAVLMSR